MYRPARLDQADMDRRVTVQHYLEIFAEPTHVKDVVKGKHLIYL
jgi:hypothetical protein